MKGIDAAAATWMRWAPLAVAWTAYLPLGTKYAVMAPSAVAAAVMVRQRRSSPTSLLLPMAALLGLLALSSLWSPAPWSDIGSHLWLYGLMLLAPWLAPAWDGHRARLALVHFVVLSMGVSLLFVLRHLAMLDPSFWWSTTVDASGNQRICNSLLLALGAAFALHLAAAPGAWDRRCGWVICAIVIVTGLALQDRRTGMLTLPLLLLAWGWIGLRRIGARMAMAATVAGAALLAGTTIEPVRARFDEGLRELAAGEPADRVASSWGQRLRMVELTAQMVQERPLAGHGVASWRTLWLQRAPQGGPLIDHTTPHNEYLLIAQQVGLPGAVLLLWLLWAAGAAAARLGRAGVPAAMVWTAIAWAGLFNVVLRDAKFSLALLMLAAVATASANADEGR